MHNAGSLTIALYKESCGGYEMPRKAVGCGAVDEVRNIEETVMSLV